jgi:hypothetical protein
MPIVIKFTVGGICHQSWYSSILHFRQEKSWAIGYNCVINHYGFSLVTAGEWIYTKNYRISQSHTKYPKYYRASLRSAQFFLSASPLTWYPGSAPALGTVFIIHSNHWTGRILYQLVRRDNIWGISCEKSRFYAKKSYFFQF